MQTCSFDARGRHRGGKTSGPLMSFVWIVLRGALGLAAALLALFVHLCRMALRMAIGLR